MIVKEHKSIEGRKIVAICDEDLIGKKFEDRRLQLDLNSNFYKGEKKTKEEVLKIFERADILNLVGKKTIEIALEAKVISKDKIIKIKNIPHAQAVLK